MTADDELINRVRQQVEDMGGLEPGWYLRGMSNPEADHSVVPLIEIPAGARVDPPSRIEVTMLPGMRIDHSQLQTGLPDISNVIEQLNDAYTRMIDDAARAVGAVGEIVVASEGYSWDSGSVTMRISARPRMDRPDEVAAAWRSGAFSRPDWLNARVFDESTETSGSGYTRGAVRHSPPLQEAESCTRFDDFGTEERDCSGCATRRADVEDREARWLKILAMETEACGDPWAAAVNVFGASPPDVASVGL